MGQLGEARQRTSLCSGLCLWALGDAGFWWVTPRACGWHAGRILGPTQCGPRGGASPTGGLLWAGSGLSELLLEMEAAEGTSCLVGPTDACCPSIPACTSSHWHVCPQAASIHTHVHTSPCPHMLPHVCYIHEPCMHIHTLRQYSTQVHTYFVHLFLGPVTCLYMYRCTYILMLVCTLCAVQDLLFHLLICVFRECQNRAIVVTTQRQQRSPQPRDPHTWCWV